MTPLTTTNTLTTLSHPLHGMSRLGERGRKYPPEHRANQLSRTLLLIALIPAEARVPNQEFLLP